MKKKTKNTLLRQWIHSFEEDSESEKVYRPSDFDFALSRRPREFFQLNQDGSLVTSDNFETDKPTSKNGKWDLDGDDTLIFYPNENEAQTQKIASIDKNRLVLKKE